MTILLQDETAGCCGFKKKRILNKYYINSLIFVIAHFSKKNRFTLSMNRNLVFKSLYKNTTIHFIILNPQIVYKKIKINCYWLAVKTFSLKLIKSIILTLYIKKIQNIINACTGNMH